MNESIFSGKFSSASEVLEREENKSQALVNELETGERSGFVGNLGRKENLKNLHAKHLNNEIQEKGESQ